MEDREYENSAKFFPFTRPPRPDRLIEPIHDSKELRATTSLARLLRATNRRDDACAMLADIYNWFTEGFDTADLKEAKASLGELCA